MTKQEEIREGIELLIAKKFSKLMPDRFPNDWLSLNGEELTRQIVEYLHSQGVVIKVEGELDRLRYCKNCESYIVTEAGFTAVEPLIGGE